MNDAIEADHPAVKAALAAARQADIGTFTPSVSRKQMAAALTAAVIEVGDWCSTHDREPDLHGLCPMRGYRGECRIVSHFVWREADDA